MENYKDNFEYKCAQSHRPFQYVKLWGSSNSIKHCSDSVPEEQDDHSNIKDFPDSSPSPRLPSILLEPAELTFSRCSSVSLICLAKPTFTRTSTTTTKHHTTLVVSSLFLVVFLKDKYNVWLTIMTCTLCQLHKFVVQNWRRDDICFSFMTWLFVLLSDSVSWLPDPEMCTKWMKMNEKSFLLS